IAGWSVFHFCRVFRKTTGTSAHQYLLEQRLQHAQRLLWANHNGAGKPMSMLDIALACGFQTPSHFSACFKRHTGQTPMQWQTAQRDAACGANGFSTG
uniref:helix-turn-helix transcriptional regulator n=1 Tax=Hydrogenophaga sp. TaxID=1904254 RepID=UPI0035640B07